MNQMNQNQTQNQTLLNKMDESIKTYIFLLSQIDRFQNPPTGYSPAYKMVLECLLKDIRTAFMDMQQIHFELMQPFN